jgi:hypothetical protein
MFPSFLSHFPNPRVINILGSKAFAQILLNLLDVLFINMLCLNPSISPQYFEHWTQPQATKAKDLFHRELAYHIKNLITVHYLGDLIKLHENLSKTIPSRVSAATRLKIKTLWFDHNGGSYPSAALAYWDSKEYHNLSSSGKTGG